MSPDNLAMLRTIGYVCLGCLALWAAVVVLARYAWHAWVMGRVSYKVASVLRDVPGVPLGVPFTPRATFWWSLRRAIRPSRTQRQLAYYAASVGRWEPWMGEPAVR